MEFRAVVRTLGMAVAAMVLTGAACGSEAPADLAAPGVEEITPDLPAPPVRPTDPVVGDIIPAGSGSVAVLATERFGSAGRLFNPPPGREYFAAEVEACAGPRERGLSFAPAYFLLEMADKTMVDTGLGIKRPELRAAVVPAGGCHSGWVTFTIPEEAVPANVLYDGSERLTWRVPAQNFGPR